MIKENDPIVRRCFASYVLVCVYLIASLHVAPAFGQEPESKPSKSDDWTFTLGAGVAYSSDYEGSNDYDIKPLPLVEVSWRDVVKIGSLSGPPSVSFKFLEVQGPKPKDRLKFTASFGYLGGRDQDDNDALLGLGDIDGGATAKLAVDYQAQDFGMALSIGHDLASDREGTTLNSSVRYGFDLGSARTRLTLGASSTWADGNYMENIFGITSTQAGRSNLGYRVYEAEAGIKDVGASLSLRHFLTRNVGITTRLGYTQLLGDAADSPIVSGQGDAGQFSGLFAISYRW